MLQEFANSYTKDYKSLQNFAKHCKTLQKHKKFYKNF